MMSYEFWNFDSLHFCGYVVTSQVNVLEETSVPNENQLTNPKSLVTFLHAPPGIWIRAVVRDRKQPMADH